MKITFILPRIGKTKKGAYLKGWLMEPLAIAVLSSLTPKNIDREFYDDRIERIPYNEPTDLVAISAETYTAKRAYEIAAEFRKRSVPVVMGGFHPTFVPEEALRHADAVVVGEAESVWVQVLNDAAKGKLRRRYQAENKPSLNGIKPDRSIFSGKKYLGLSLVETGRGCRFDCEFCSIASFYGNSHRSRPIEDVVSEVRGLSSRKIFFVDDNICADMNHAKELFLALIPLNIKWVSQASINIARDESLLVLMKKSGCIGVLIGFESLDGNALSRIGKKVNGAGAGYSENLRRLRKHGIAVYSTFIFGYDTDVPESFAKTLAFSKRQKLFLSAFNHLVPFPGTRLYRRLQREKRLIENNWWLSPEYRFGDVSFRPKNMTANTLAELCYKCRQDFYTLSSIVTRGFEFQANCPTPYMAMLFIAQNFFNAREVRRRQGLRLGCKEVEAEHTGLKK